MATSSTSLHRLVLVLFVLAIAWVPGTRAAAFDGISLLGTTATPTPPPAVTSAETSVDEAAETVIEPPYQLAPVPIHVLVFQVVSTEGGTYLVLVEQLTLLVSGFAWAQPAMSATAPSQDSLTGAAVATAGAAATEELGHPGEGRAAVRWAIEDAINTRNPNNGELGHTAWHGWCLGMVARAWSIGAGRTVPHLQSGTANGSREKFVAAGLMRPAEGSIPAGAPVFWNCGSVGHIAIATGENDENGEPLIASTWVGGSLDGIFVRPLSWFTPYVGTADGWGYIDGAETAGVTD